MITLLNEHIGILIDSSYETAMKIEASELRQLLFKHKVIVFKNWMNLDADLIYDFMSKLGTPWTSDMYAKSKESVEFDKHNRPYHNYNNYGNFRLFKEIPWHRDIDNEEDLPRCPTRGLYCVDFPSNVVGQGTSVSNMVAAYRNLSATEKDFFDSLYLTFQSWQRPGTNIVSVPAVDIHPYTNEKFLRLNAVGPNAWVINAFKRENGADTPVNLELIKQYVSDIGDKYSYSHNWEIGDLLIFDNWGTMHRKDKGNILPGSNGLRKFIRVSVDTNLYDNTNTK